MGERVYVAVERRAAFACARVYMFKQLYYLSRHLYVTEETEIAKIYHANSAYIRGHDHTNALRSY